MSDAKFPPQPDWLAWSKRLNSIAQIGLTYGENEYDRERYEQIREIALEMAQAYTQDSPEIIKGLFTQESAYPTPKVDVRGVVFNDEGQVLLVQEASDQKWTLPGGWADVGDTPKNAVEREIFEESGYTAEVVRLLGVYDRDNQGYPAHPDAIYKICFLCKITGGEAKTSHETSGVGWYDVDDLPELSLGRTMPHNLEKFQQMWRDNQLEADYD